MLRTLLIAGTLLAASGAAFAHGDDYGRVISVEPRFVISFGTRHADGFRVLYESGGDRYWTHTSYYPGPVIVLPPQYVAQPVYYREYPPGWARGYGRGWEGHRHWDDRHEDDWREARHDHWHGWREHHDRD